MVKNIYKAYGLIIQSDIELSELIEARGQPDIDIRIGNVVDILAPIEDKSQNFHVDKNYFYLKLEGVANFLVRNGNEIFVQPSQQCRECELRLYLLGTCLGILLHQRGILALHASAIETKNGAVAFTGPPGSGKSTLMTAFLEQGYNMLADDVTGIVLDQENLPIVLPAIPRSKLWADAIQHLGYDLNRLKRVRPDEEKYDLAVQEHFAQQPAPLHKIYLLSRNEQDEIQIETLDRMFGFQVILENTYREFYLNGLGKREIHFQLASTAARYASVKLVSHPAKFQKMEELVKLIEEDFLAKF